MLLRRSDAVRHPEYGPGVVQEVLGQLAIVEFFGESIQVSTADLELAGSSLAPVPSTSTRSNAHFRQAFEAINLGVVPPDPAQLIALSINGEKMASAANSWLASARTEGLCKVVFGDYGSGKSHYLRVIESAALTSGWVVSYVEFDPKEADPAKPHLVYRSLMSSLRFPKRDDGTQSHSFVDMIREMRLRWEAVTCGKQFQTSPWFRSTFSVLRQFPHASSTEYLDTCAWLAGAPVLHRVVHSLCRERRAREVPSSMPRSKECAEIYVHHLVVIDEVCRALGYKGLLLILDEAEHVRGFNVRRRERANNFFDLLARSAHVPLKAGPDPLPNEHNHSIPKYWKEGPHFAVVVGLTEGDTFSDRSLSLREACVFLHAPEDAVRLSKPTEKQYESWCSTLLHKFHEYDPEPTELLSSDANRQTLARLLAREYRKGSSSENSLRTWTKLAALVPSMVLSKTVLSIEELEHRLALSAQQASGRQLPWEGAANA